VGLIHWACQTNKESIYLVSEGLLSMDLAEDGGTGYPEKLWCVKLIRADTDSDTSSPPPPPPPPDDDPPEDEKIKDKPDGTPGPSELFRAMERLSSGGLKGSTSQSGTTAPVRQSSTLPQHNLGFNPDSVHANELGNKINLPPGFIDPAAHVEEDVDFGEDCSSNDDCDDFVPSFLSPDSPPPPSPPGSPPDIQICIPCGDPVVNLPTQPTSRRVTPVAQTESEIESIRHLKLTKEARDKEDKYEALHSENDRRISKLNAITMAEDAELARQIEETIVQLHIDQLPRLTVPRNHVMSTRHHSPPEVAQCALKDCNKEAFIIGGTASLCCSRNHLKYLQALRSKTRCALPECERPVYFRPDLLLAYDFRCINHAKLANKYGNKPKAEPGWIKCGFPSCDNLVFYYSTIGHYDFCGMTCRKRTANLPVTPPMLELTCTRFTTLAAGAVPPPSNPPSAPESVIDYGTPPDTPAPLTTQPAPLAIHPPIHTAPPATTHPPTHIPLALLPTPMPEAYVSNWAAHYITGSSNPSPVRTLSVADTHSVRSTPPVIPPLPHTEVDVFIVRMENEPGETPSSSSHVLPPLYHEDEAPPPSNLASVPASDYDESDSESLSDSSSHGGSHAQTSVCSIFSPSASLMSRAHYAFSAASRSYSAIFKEKDDSPDVILRGATRAITNARSKFGLDLHARHSRRVNKSRRTYNGDLDSDPISLPPFAGGSYENSEDEASPLRGAGEARTPEFAPEYGPSDTPGVPPGPPRRTFNPEQGHLFSYPISAAPAEGTAPPLAPSVPSLISTAPPAYSGLLSPHLRPSTPAPSPPSNRHFGMDSGYDAFQHPWYDPNGDLVSHASLSSARSEPVAAPVRHGWI